MATVTSNSTLTTYLPPRKKARIELEGTEDAFKPVGSLSILIDKFREFSDSVLHGEETNNNSKRHCDAKVRVRGLTFGLAVRSLRLTSRKDPTYCMGVVLSCENISGCNVEGDGSWSCLASATYLIKTPHNSRQVDIYESTHRFSSKDKSSLEWKVPMPFDALLDPEIGLYDEKNDTLELTVKISVDAPIGVMELSKTDTIQVNRRKVFFNKNLLAVHSRYFHSLFYNAQFDDGQSGDYKVEIEAPATVEHFERMLATMYPENKPLDDQCIEGVLTCLTSFW